MGVEGSRRILQAGANDLGGTLMDENISRAAGATHGQEMDVDTLEALVEPARATTAPTKHPVPDAVTMDELIERFLDELQRESPHSPRTASTSFARSGPRSSNWRGRRRSRRPARRGARRSTNCSRRRRLFAAWRDVPSSPSSVRRARNPTPTLYEMARALSAAMAERDWMIVSGAGPGIMEASSKGAGREPHARRQYRIALRAVRQSLHRRRDDARRHAVLLHAQGRHDASVERVRHLSRWSGHDGRDSSRS